jgi:hypothetical protein
MMAIMLFEGGEDMVVMANYEDIQRGERMSLKRVISTWRFGLGFGSPS